MAVCEGSGDRRSVSTGQRQQTAGYARPNRATGVRCRSCGREFAACRIVYQDHGIPVRDGQAVVPRHNTPS